MSTNLDLRWAAENVWGEGGIHELDERRTSDKDDKSQLFKKELRRLVRLFRLRSKASPLLQGGIQTPEKCEMRLHRLHLRALLALIALVALMSSTSRMLQAKMFSF